jgi:hypothetical protein
MMLNSIILGMLVVFFLGGIWFLLAKPQCPACGVRLHTVGEDVRPWGRSGIDAVFYYECPRCTWATARRQTLTHFD